MFVLSLLWVKIKSRQERDYVWPDYHAPSLLATLCGLRKVPVVSVEEGMLLDPVDQESPLEPRQSTEIFPLLMDGMTVLSRYTILMASFLVLTVMWCLCLIWRERERDTHTHTHTHTHTLSLSLSLSHTHTHTRNNNWQLLTLYSFIYFSPCRRFCCSPRFALYDENKSIVAKFKGPCCPYQDVCFTDDLDYKVCQCLLEVHTQL